MNERAIVFDMDGVLIDSEPLWRRAEIECFGEVGLELTEKDCLETTGLRIDEAAEYWYARFPWSGDSTHVVATRIVERMVVLIEREGVPMPGVHGAIHAARSRGWRIALASSSSMRLIETVLACFRLREAFEVVRSAEDEERGKPHPDVYLSAAADLDMAGSCCLAVEDSANGVASALAAGMRCVAIPPVEAREDPRFDAATWRLDSLEELQRALPELESAWST